MVGIVSVSTAMVDSREYSCADIHEMTVAHLSEVQSKIADLKKLETALEQMAAECSRGDVPECPIVETLFELPNAQGWMSQHRSNMAVVGQLLPSWFTAGTSALPPITVVTG